MTALHLLKKHACLGLLLVIILGFFHSVRADIPMVAAASNLRFAMGAIEQAFTEESGLSVNTVFGSSGNFYRQIRQGAPYKVFLSADESYVKQLEFSHFTAEKSFVYGIGRLVYFAPHHSTLDPSQGMGNLKKAVEEHRIRRFAIANPNHAPYGKAAIMTLQNLGIAHDIRHNLVFGENISQAAQLAIGESTDGGLFAYSLIFSELVSNQGNYWLVPSTMHSPLLQRAALLKGANETATRFYHFLNTEKARNILSRYGFEH